MKQMNNNARRIKFTRCTPSEPYPSLYCSFFYKNNKFAQIYRLRLLHLIKVKGLEFTDFFLFL